MALATHIMDYMDKMHKKLSPPVKISIVDLVVIQSSMYINISNFNMPNMLRN